MTKSESSSSKSHKASSSGCSSLRGLLDKLHASSQTLPSCFLPGAGASASASARAAEATPLDGRGRPMTMVSTSVRVREKNVRADASVFPSNPEKDSVTLAVRVGDAGFLDLQTLLRHPRVVWPADLQDGRGLRPVVTMAKERFAVLRAHVRAAIKALSLAVRVPERYSVNFLCDGLFRQFRGHNGSDDMYHMLMRTFGNFPATPATPATPAPTPTPTLDTLMSGLSLTQQL